MKFDRTALTARIGAHLAYLREMGIEEIRVPEAKPGKRRAPTGAAGLEKIRADLGECTRCPLHRGRHTLVFGEGSPRARLAFVGEGPGRDEDLQGRPFVGRAGQLLNQIIEAMGLRREEVYIANVVKCRPPNNRVPQRREMETCSPFLFRQLRAIGPEIVCTLGGVATQTVLETQAPISKLRGRFTAHRGLRILPTFHPAYLLRNPNMKREVWKDMQLVMDELGLDSPVRRRGRR